MVKSDIKYVISYKDVKIKVDSTILCSQKKH